MSMPEVVIDFSPTKLLSEIKTEEEFEFHKYRFHVPTSSRFVADVQQVEGTPVAAPPSGVSSAMIALAIGGIFLGALVTYFVLKLKK